MDRITIITAGPLGLSIGLGLKHANLQNTEVVGTSGYSGLLTKGAKMGAFDSTSRNLKSALEGAQLVILDSPAGETRELMEAIGPILEKGCVVTDTGTNKVQVLEWAKEYYSYDVNFVAGRPQPRNPMSEIEDAEVDAFAGTNYSIVPSERATPEAVKTVVGLAEILGAKPMFIDPVEHDSYSCRWARSGTCAAASARGAGRSRAHLLRTLGRKPEWRPRRDFEVCGACIEILCST